MATLHPNFIVGIGGSAGSLNPFMAFFDALPLNTGMAFVVISHIYPTANSQLAEILSRHTKMTVQVVLKTTPIIANHVYVLPPNADIQTDGYSLFVTSPASRNKQIDIFLTSLAKTVGERAIGIIFSGYHGDGTEGCGKIKSAGGITFAQDETAEVSSMPLTPQSFGYIDFVLAPDKIPAALVKLQSINVELETMKEKLESSNEELVTLNAEAGARNEELAHLDKARHALMKTVAGKDEFISMLAHELRNPLTPILHSIEVMKLERKDDKELQGMLTVIERQAQNISLILKGLLDTSRAIHGKITLETKLLDLKIVCEYAIETVEPLLKEAGHTLEVVWEKKSHLITGDSLRLEQVFVNLLSNAIKYTPPHGKISLSVVTAHGHVDVKIKDNGLGVPKALHSKIFDLFMQTNQVETPKKGGLGVGLTLSRLLVELHGGTLTLKSDGAGKGSEFTVHLPLIPLTENVKNMPTINSHTKDQREILRTHGKRILIIDDDILLANTFAKLLNALHYDVRVAYDARTAHEVANEFIPEVVFMDLSMPIVDGYELVKQLKKLPMLSGAYFIALSGMGDEASIKKALSSGFHKHLIKPVGTKQITEVIEEIQIS